MTNIPYFVVEMIKQLLGSPVVCQFYDTRLFGPWSIIPSVLKLDLNDKNNLRINQR